VLARLDRVYSFQATRALKTVAEYEILGNYNHSDHFPIWYKILLNRRKKKSAYKMSDLHLKDPTVSSKFHDIWAANNRLPFFGRLQRCVKFYKEFSICKAREWKLTETNIRQQFEAAVVVLQANPSDAEVQANLSKHVDSLQVFETRKAAGQQLRSRLKWNRVGNNASKEFYRATKERSGAS
jgi:hypothetical protein